MRTIWVRIRTAFNVLLGRPTIAFCSFKGPINVQGRSLIVGNYFDMTDT